MRIGDMSFSDAFVKILNKIEAKTQPRKKFPAKSSAEKASSRGPGGRKTRIKTFRALPGKKVIDDL